MELLAPRFHVLAPDCYGTGKTPAPDRPATLRDEVELLAPVFHKAGDPFVVVGHSYGAGVALVAAALHPKRVRALALYEPTIFALAPAEETEGIRNTARLAREAVEAGNNDRAAQVFIDFWMGGTTWDRMPDARKAPILASIVHVGAWEDALFREPTPLADFAALDIPVLLMTGKKSPLSSLAVARVLRGAFRNVKAVEFDALAHMGPLTHPDAVNKVIADFL
jgi:pimeloyl-ACP methyl ester carboxylesterase